MSFGAFQTSRQIFSNPIWLNVVEFRMFFLIYGKAVFAKEGCEIAGIKLKRGQWLRSYRNLRNDLEYIENRAVKLYSLSRITRAVEGLVKKNRIKIKTTELGTLFTVVNYDKYQSLGNYEEITETEMKQQANRDGTVTEQQWNNNKNVKKEKNNIDEPKVKKPKKKKPPKSKEQIIAELKAVYPYVDVDYEITQMDIWLEDHPRRKFNKSFANRWLKKAKQHSPKDTYYDENYGYITYGEAEKIMRESAADEERLIREGKIDENGNIINSDW